MTLGDVRRVVKRMGMDAEAYYPPEMDVRYFTRFARKAFLSVYPGREIVNNSDLQYYQNLALYSPALVRIGRVNGQIRRFNARAGSWQKLIDYTYFHPQVQVK
ncbi:MAG: hypothetical protein QG549_296 [Patescibacteria group bacterium]|mgnify:CR=1 FL=1|nr:hypothetical protein [Patescibacteria group bacterium]